MSASLHARLIVAFLCVVLTACSESNQSSNSAQTSESSEEIELADGSESGTGGFSGGTTTTTRDSSGQQYVFSGTGLVFPKNSSGAFSDAMWKGTGQFLHVKRGEILTGGQVVSHKATKLVLEFADREIVFDIGQKTRICDGKRSFPLTALVEGDMVVVVAKSATPMIAESIRKGPMLLKTGGVFGSGSASYPVNYRCN